MPKLAVLKAREVEEILFKHVLKCSIKFPRLKLLSAYETTNEKLQKHQTSKKQKGHHKGDNRTGGFTFHLNECFFAFLASLVFRIHLSVIVALVSNKN